MQLKKNPSIRLALAAASCALLTEYPAQAAETNDWVVNFGTLFYKEKDRVSIVEPILIATHNFNDEDYLSVRLVNDTMSGASPLGASVSSETQTIPAHTLSSASGGATSSTSSKTVPPYALPLNNFSDQRNSVGVDWQKAYSRTFRSILGANFSSENDYTSVGGSVTLQHDTTDKLTTFTLGLSYSLDTVQPIGGVPDSLTTLSTTTNNLSAREEEDDGPRRSGDDEFEGENPGKQKRLSDILFGITQVISRRVLTQLNYSYGQSNGYLTDPYKIISQVDPTTGFTDENNYRTEKRPDSRVRQAVYWKTVVHLPSDVIHLTYRYYWDDWSIKAHTAEIKYRFNIGDHFYLMPNYRYYQQSGASFFKYSLLSGEPLPNYASADLRLAPMYSTTSGLKLGYNFKRNTEISFRAEYMQQKGESNPAEAVGSQRQVELFPKLEVMMYTFELSMDF